MRAITIEENIIRRYAAIDMGSNSFQLLILQRQQTADGGWKQLLQRKQRVQLAAGLDENNRLTEVTVEKALAVLADFCQLIEPFQPLQLRVVGTKALRQATNSADFLCRASEVLGHPAEIIDGIEEARLIYQGVVSSLAVSKEKARLIIDVGGGSTEFAVGQGASPQLLESLSLGCVSFQRKFFAEGNITKKALALSESQATQQLLSLREKLKVLNWQVAIGCSGVFEALLEVQQTLVPEKRWLTVDGLEAIYEKLLTFKNSEDIDLATLGDNRKRILPAALTLVLAIFRTLKISQMELTTAALKDGLIFEMQNEQHAQIPA